MKTLAGGLLAGWLAVGGAFAQDGTSAGALRIWGHGSRADPVLIPLIEKLEAGFRRHYPDARFENTLRGDDTAIGGLYTKAADLALMERRLSAIEVDAYEPIFKSKPLEFTIATGSMAIPQHANALAILVHSSNPVRRLSLAQVDAVFDADHRRGAAPVRTWGDVGAGGAWRERPMHVYVPSLESDDAQQFVKALFAGGQKWNGELREVRDSAAAARAVARDPAGIALSTSRFAGKRAPALAIGEKDGGPFYKPGASEIAQHRYPLARPVYVFANPPLDARAAAFIRYVLSEEGQAIIRRDGGYYALPTSLAKQEKEKLQ